MAESPESKRIKMESNSDEINIAAAVADDAVTDTTAAPTCQFFVKRKKRYCRLTPAKNEIYCGEHLPVTEISQQSVGEEGSANNSAIKRNARVPCPLNPKHTVCARKLHKHVKICNALVKDCPEYIVSGLNAGSEEIEPNLADFKLTDVDAETIDEIVDKINKLYAAHKIDEKIDELTASHPLLESELSNNEYGHETLRHLIQTSTILAYLNHFQLFDDHTSYVEYGAGRGQVSYWLAKAIKTNYPNSNSNVLLIDRAAVRYKKDNKLNEDESHAVQRVRADIADFDISKHHLIQTARKIVGLGKHLCGAATDFALRCSVHGNNVVETSGNGPKTTAILIALCCHHRCEWKHLVGKEFFMENGISVKEFIIITKMVGWAICGTGMSRARRNEIEKQRNDANTAAGNETNTPIQINGNADRQPSSTKRDRHERKAVGQKCKRLIDYARIRYLEQNGFECSLKRYVSSDITLENICLVAIQRN